VGEEPSVNKLSKELAPRQKYIGIEEIKAVVTS
jgi:hypothetical protein